MLNCIVTRAGQGVLKSVFIVERTEESLEESGEKTISEINMQTEIQMAHKEDGNTKIRLRNLGILFERLIS